MTHSLCFPTSSDTRTGPTGNPVLYEYPLEVRLWSDPRNGVDPSEGTIRIGTPVSLGNRCFVSGLTDSDFEHAPLVWNTPVCRGIRHIPPPSCSHPLSPPPTLALTVSPSLCIRQSLTHLLYLPALQPPLPLPFVLLVSLSRSLSLSLVVSLFGWGS